MWAAIANNTAKITKPINTVINSSFWFSIKLCYLWFDLGFFSLQAWASRCSRILSNSPAGIFMVPYIVEQRATWRLSCNLIGLSLCIGLLSCSSRAVLCKCKPKDLGYHIADSCVKFKGCHKVNTPQTKALARTWLPYARGTFLNVARYPPKALQRYEIFSKPQRGVSKIIVQKSFFRVYI